MLAEILVFTRRATICYTQCLIGTVVEESLVVVSGFLEEKRIRLKKRLSSEPLCILGDFQQIKQVCINLFNNAAEAMKPGGTLSVSVRPLPLTAGMPYPSRSMTQVEVFLGYPAKHIQPVLHDKKMVGAVWVSHCPPDRDESWRQGSCEQQGRNRRRIQGNYSGASHLIPIFPLFKRMNFLFSLLRFQANCSWGCSSAGRAMRSQRIGRRFDPVHLHQ